MMGDGDVYHVPVLLKQSVDGLVTDPDGVYVDATFGGGGHSREIVSRLGGNGHLYGFDQDQDTMKNIIEDPRFTFVYSNFRYMRNFMRWYGHDKVNGILADLGVSWHHFDDSSRGFSFRFDGPIDMRMNQKEGMTAADVLNGYPEEKLASLFYLYGELQNGRQLAQAIGRKRQNTRIETVSMLMDTVRPVIGREREKKEMAKVFQALRMEVNHEVDALREMLLSTVDLLVPDGRLVVITYHSIEDRMVKNLIKSGNIEGEVMTDFYGNRLIPFRQVCKPVLPDFQEQERNPRSRSAKLRIASKV
ncbi:MAG: 16S rRNA (cytosine(1402)-N(4))-methyltransferase RsmH [Bacteroidaceae bacterium]|nr:16S rRNA (cytosine(1402)-N(4))-methyltransferase RsmH [Bacteroidaceae bacterium]